MKGLAVIVATGLSLAGCGSGHTSSSPTTTHYPMVVHSPLVLPADGLKPPPGLTESAQFLSPTRLGIVTLGSSSCPSVPDELVIQSPHTIRLHLTVGSRSDDRIVAHPPPGGVCTADYGTTPMAIAIDPKEIDVHHPLTVSFIYEGRTEPVVRTAAPL